MAEVDTNHLEKGPRHTQLLISSAFAIFALVSLPQGYLAARLSGGPVKWREILFSCAHWLLLCGLSYIPIVLAVRFPVPSKRSTIAHILGLLAFSISWSCLAVSIGVGLGLFEPDSQLLGRYLTSVVFGFSYAGIIYAAILGYIYAYGYFLANTRREADAARLEAQLAETRLNSLRMQLNPHFLFNTLNAVLVLVRESNVRAASEMLERLGELLQQVLKANRPKEIPLREELHLVEQYLSIQQVRFSNRLRIEWSIDDRARTALVPDLLMQPVVENAIHYGVSQRSQSGTVVVEARVIGNTLELSVGDDGPGFDTTASERLSNGIGLQNTRERLRTLYGTAASLTIEAVPPTGTQVTLRLPFREAGQ
jgi:two-component system LytT family sensor kinase